MKIYSTLSRKKETLNPLQKGKIGMYVCGPTVYDHAHLGHGRSAVSFDLIRKYLLYKDFNVTFVFNYTDIDDKMINRAAIMKITVPELAELIIPEYTKDYADLGVLEPDVRPRATEHVEEMIAIIKGLEKAGCIYALDDGVYFDVTKFKEYGKLSGQKLDELKSGARVALKEDKRNPQDFVLWKFSKEGEPTWKSPWGDGRPGWHIECSAMSSKYLGESFDIHGGGADLIFPHHECEIAQSESCFKKPFAKYWLHNGFIQINNEKMSKSLGNFFTLKDIFKKYHPQVVRFLFLQTHYRSPIEFSEELLQQSKNALMRLHDFMQRLKDFVPVEPNGPQKDVSAFIAKTKEKFEAALDDDFEAAEALAAVYDFVKEINRRIDAKDLTRDSLEEIMTFLMRIDAVLGIIAPTATEDVSAEIKDLIAKREDARKNRDWKMADKFRAELLEMGIQIEDTAKGTVWKKL